MTFITIISLAFITFTTRYLFLEGRLPLRLGLNVKQILSFSAPAVLTAIFVPILLIQKQELNIGYTNQYLWGGITAICAAYKTQSVYWTISIGTAVFIIGSALF
ncbi:MAG: AzlD domain-containing protein [SAR92 clade bacterium]|uniref:AzlD domain-containing protein n=1 Tax=SAR92 clade bacterium TaxID=2315479 RepID=A0A520MHS1_9GAMM|nr:MAG: AzlD domain-containing protein [SAR92 clade bacterium]